VDAETRVTQILRESLGIDVGSSDSDIIATGLLDSLSLVRLLVEIEQEFGVSIRLDKLEIDSVSSVRRIVALLNDLDSPSSPSR
jgi:acyl carrier protein